MEPARSATAQIAEIKNIRMIPANTNCNPAEHIRGGYRIQYQL